MVARLAAKAAHWVRIFQKSLDTQPGQYILAGRKTYFKKTFLKVRGTVLIQIRIRVSMHKAYEPDPRITVPGSRVADPHSFHPDPAF
jgi:hypothetical protein